MQIVPKYINSKRNVTTLVVGTAIFCLLFLNIFRPFFDLLEKLDINIIDPSITYFLLADAIALVALGVIAISRVLMYKWVKKGNQLTYLIYALWITGEVLAMAVIFSTFVFYVGTPKETFGELFVKVLLYTGFTLLLPYLIFHFYFAWDNKSRLLVELERENKVNNSIQPIVVTPDRTSILLRFNDEKGNPKLTVAIDNLYFIESADNYAKICYSHQGKIQYYMHRATMKSIEELYPDYLIRCHRSYIVNINKVKLIRREDDGLYIGLDTEKVPNIPISKTYSNRLFSALSGTTIQEDKPTT